MAKQFYFNAILMVQENGIKSHTTTTLPDIVGRLFQNHPLYDTPYHLKIINIQKKRLNKRTDIIGIVSHLGWVRSSFDLCQA